MRKNISLLAFALLVSFTAPIMAQDASPTPSPSPAPQASQPAPLPIPTTFQLEVDQADLAAISNALMELPKKVADPIINELDARLQAQMAARAAAAKPTEEKK